MLTTATTPPRPAMTGPKVPSRDRNPLAKGDATAPITPAPAPRKEPTFMAAAPMGVAAKAVPRPDTVPAAPLSAPPIRPSNPPDAAAVATAGAPPNRFPMPPKAIAPTPSVSCTSPVFARFCTECPTFFAYLPTPVFPSTPRIPPPAWAAVMPLINCRRRGTFLCPFFTLSLLMGVVSFLGHTKPAPAQGCSEPFPAPWPPPASGQGRAERGFRCTPGRRGRRVVISSASSSCCAAQRPPSRWGARPASGAVPGSGPCGRPCRSSR